MLRKGRKKERKKERKEGRQEGKNIKGVMSSLGGIYSGQLKYTINLIILLDKSLENALSENTVLELLTF